MGARRTSHPGFKFPGRLTDVGPSITPELRSMSTSFLEMTILPAGVPPFESSPWTMGAQPGVVQVEPVLTRPNALLTT